MLFFIMKRKLLIKIYLLALVIPLLLLFSFLSHNNFDAYVSSKSACEFLLKNYRIENTIICSKSLVRGVKFFTDKDVAVINVGGGNFFSPHPVLYLNSDGKVSDFLKKQPTTYCILTKSSFTDVQRITSSIGFKLYTLKIIGNEYIVIIQAG
jgi:hypothetical protein